MVNSVTSKKQLPKVADLGMALNALKGDPTRDKPGYLFNLRRTQARSAPLYLQYDDGGRAAAGFKGVTKDCTVRAAAIAEQRPYRDVYWEVTSLLRKGRWAKSVRGGVARAAFHRYMLYHRGWEYIDQKDSPFCALDIPLRGTYILALDTHAMTVIDRVVHDISDQVDSGLALVYGYYQKPGT